MTFIAPHQTRDARSLGFLFRGHVKPKARILIADEDGARRALGTDGQLPAVALAGSSLEHLARIALG